MIFSFVGQQRMVQACWLIFNFHCEAIRHSWKLLLIALNCWPLCSQISSNIWIAHQEAFMRRRRGQVILNQRVLHWRLKKAKKHMITFLPDICSAFPSLGHLQLEAVIEDDFEDESDKAIMKNRHRRSFVLFQCHQNEQILVWPGSGGLQGVQQCIPT